MVDSHGARDESDLHIMQMFLSPHRAIVVANREKTVTRICRESTPISSSADPQNPLRQIITIYFHFPLLAPRASHSLARDRLSSRSQKSEIHLFRCVNFNSNLD